MAILVLVALSPPVLAFIYLYFSLCKFCNKGVLRGQGVVFLWFQTTQCHELYRTPQYLLYIKYIYFILNMFIIKER